MRLGDTYYCKQCGSQRVEAHMYVNVNTLEVEDDPEWDDNTPCWCHDCGNNTKLTTDFEEWKDWVKANKGDELRDLRKDKDDGNIP